MKTQFFKVILPLLVIAFCFSACKKDPVDEPVTNLASKQSHEVVTLWADLYLVIEKDLAGFRPAPTSRALVYIGMAAYETALPGMPDFISNSTKLQGLSIPALPKAVSEYSWEVAVNAAYAQSYKNFMPKANAAQIQLIDDLAQLVYDNNKSKISDEVMQNSIIWGNAVAKAILDYANTDLEGASQSIDPFPTSYSPPVGPFLWRTAPGEKALSPYFGSVRTFATFGSQLRALPPPTPSSDPNSAYYKDFKEVNDVIANLTPDARARAEFWSDDIVGLTFSPPARILALAAQMTDKEDLNLEEALHLFLKIGIAENDAAVAAWGSKYFYNVERPTHFIPDHINPSFKTILGNAIGKENLTPPFPGYPSGHSTFGGLGISVLAHFFGENYNFTDYCHYGRTEFASAPRSYTTQTQIGEENAYSRIPLGVHPRFDCSEGLRLGRLIGDNAVNYNVKK